MFNNQIQHYTQKYNQIKESIPETAIEQVIMGTEGIKDIGDVRTELMSNSELFSQICYNIAKTLMPGRVSCTTYAAVVARFMEKFGIPYKVMSGFCLPKGHHLYASELQAFKDKRAQGIEHPMFATHVYLTALDKDYEYYNGSSSEIDHIDCVEIARG